MTTTTYRSGNDKIGYCTITIHDPRGEPITEERIQEIKKNRANLERCCSACYTEQYGVPMKATILWGGPDLDQCLEDLRAKK